MVFVSAYIWFFVFFDSICVKADTWSYNNMAYHINQQINCCTFLPKARCVNDLKFCTDFWS